MGEKSTTMIKKSSFVKHWVKTRRIQILTKFLRSSIFKRAIENLLELNGRHSIPKTTIIDKDVYRHINTIAKCSEYSAENMNIHLKDAIFKLLLVAGYLTIAEETDFKYLLKIPNKEIEMEFKTIITEYHAITYGADFTNASEALIGIKDADWDNNASLNGAISNFAKEFSKNLKFYPVFVKTMEDVNEGVMAKEDLIHSILVAINVNCKGAILGNEIWYENKARCDVINIFKKAKRCMIFEVKYEGNAKKALMQIVNNNYIKILKDKKMEKGEIKEAVFIGFNVSENKEVYCSFQIAKVD